MADFRGDLNCYSHFAYWLFMFQPRVYQETKVAADLVAQGQEDLWTNVFQASDEVLNKQSDISFMEQILLLSDSAPWLKDPLITLLFLLVIWKLVISLIRKLEQQTKNRKLAEYAYQQKDKQFKRNYSDPPAIGSGSTGNPAR